MNTIEDYQNFNLLKFRYFPILLVQFYGYIVFLNFIPDAIE
jgi:hypothetical protein